MEMPEERHRDWGFSLLKGGGINSLSEVCLHQCSQCGQKTGRGGNHGATGKPWHGWAWWKHGGMGHTTGELQWLLVNSSEGISREGRGGSGVVLNVGECLSCFEMFNDSDDKVEYLWVRIQWKANKAENPCLLQNTQQGSRGRWNTLISSWEEFHNS